MWSSADDGLMLMSDVAQESAQGNGSAVADGILHSVAVVVTQSNVTFYMDGYLQSSAILERPVTDCHGKALEIGDSNIPSLGELTFFARALTEVEMREIMFAGFTLQVFPTHHLTNLHGFILHWCSASESFNLAPAASWQQQLERTS